MTIDLSALILATDEAATAALAQAQHPITVDHAEVDRILATLPAKAAEGRRDEPSKGLFTLWNGYGLAAGATAAAVHARLAYALDSGHTTDDAGMHRVLIPYAAVERTAQNIRTNAWILDVRATWSKRGGTIEPDHDTRCGALNFAHEQGFHTVTINLTRSPADVVEEAATALRLPLWTIEGLTKAWGPYRANDPDNVHWSGITEASGAYRDGIYRAVPCVVFARRDDSFAIDLDDARTLDAATLIARAADALGLTVAPVVAPAPAKPVNVATVQQEPVKVAPTVPQGQGNGNRQQGNGKPGQGVKR